MIRSDVAELQYITPIANVASILEHGILSHNEAAKIAHQSVAVAEIQDRRANKQVPGGGRLHDYANLYFSARNPMMFKRKDQHDSLCVLRVNPVVLELPGVVVTDRRSPILPIVGANMITVLTGDLFSSRAQTLVNTVNCVGVMGKGIALEFKNRFPDMFRDYAARCRRGEVQLGRPYLYRTLMPPWILDFPTKGHWRAVSNIRDIIAGLDFLEAHYEEWGITSLAVPPLGCGNGGLEWRVVGPVLYQRLSKLDIPIELYAPVGTDTDELQSEFLSRGDSPAQRHGVGESKGEPQSTARERRLSVSDGGSKARRTTAQ